ncbi:MAG: hypothetical protein Q8R02_23660 [Hyphomonadaceae bacterium]|nr:hypothetical protein [Hyphomonadaceae bacterium]
MNRQLVLALAATGILAGAPVAVPQAPPVAFKPAAPPPTSPALAPPVTGPALTAPIIVPVQPKPVTAAPRPQTLSDSLKTGSSSSSGAAASPPPGAESADIPQSGAGYDPCLHPTNPPSYCKQDAQ